MIDVEITHDTLLRGRVRLLQPARGFRSSLDPVLLAGFVQPPYRRFVDIGCGTGPVAFLLLARDADAEGVGVEIQPRLASLAARGAVENGYGRRFEVRAGDVRTPGVIWGRFDLVVTNPPFRPLGTAVLPSDRERSVANHEVTLQLSDWLDAGARLLAARGRLAAIFPADRGDELRAGLLRRGLALTRLRLVLSHEGAPARRLLVEAELGRSTSPPQIEPPLIVHDGTGFTREVRRLMGELVD
jgi:tRNA1(Val) A37 N6-methylase TrmN6